MHPCRIRDGVGDAAAAKALQKQREVRLQLPRELHGCPLFATRNAREVDFKDRCRWRRTEGPKDVAQRGIMDRRGGEARNVDEGGGGGCGGRLHGEVDDGFKLMGPGPGLDGAWMDSGIEARQ